jgi:large subunit ribosomal protein L32
MAVPKRKKGRIKTNHRRANWKDSAENTQECPQCREAKLPHRVCGFCGYYKGKEVVETEA